MKNLPRGWNAAAHSHWHAGRRHEAIQAAIDHLNACGADKPTELVLQLAYYFFLIKDYRAAATILEYQVERHPQHLETVLNLAVCCTRLQRFPEAVRHAETVLRLAPDNMMAQDILANTHYQLGHPDAASAAGTTALTLKDRKCREVDPAWELPSGSPHEFDCDGDKRDVIAFSLWGQNPRYLRGALQNVLRAREHFPGWTLRFYLDASVPEVVVGVLRQLSADVIEQAASDALRQKLGWRFQVANDPKVGRFLVRDTDSVFSAREALAVAEWLASDAWFHVIRDWWTHSDLILAGLWGGVAGVLPPLQPLLDTYVPTAAETPNIDQWFLRDCVWSYVRQSCLMHDRCFRLPGSRPLPGPEPAGNAHVGQDEFAVRRDAQARELAPLLRDFPPLAGVLGMDGIEPSGGDQGGSN